MERSLQIICPSLLFVQVSEGAGPPPTTQKGYR